MTGSILNVTDLVVTYGQVVSLSEVNIEVLRGEIVTVLGANGAGKSTLINTVSGIRRPSKGRIEFLGKEITLMPTHRIVALGIVQIPESKAALSRLKVSDNLKIAAYLRKDSERVKQDMEMVYQQFPILARRQNQYAVTLSGGEQRMLAIGMALMARPKLIMLDEPSLGLAPLIVTEVFEIISRLRLDGITILLVEQNARKALLYSDRGYILETGHVVLTDRSERLLANAKVQEAYLGMKRPLE